LDSTLTFDQRRANPVEAEVKRSPGANFPGSRHRASDHVWSRNLPQLSNLKATPLESVAFKMLTGYWRSA